MRGPIYGLAKIMTITRERRRITLTRWAIIETEHGRRHFIGHCDDYGETRVSATIVSFDVTALRGVSISGRIYRLSGPPRRDAIGDEVLARWRSRNAVALARDITEEVLCCPPKISTAAERH